MTEFLSLNNATGIHIIITQNMTKILYGAAVQGIQGFIFQTNTLKEIIGASELVERVCTSAFAEQIGSDVDSLVKDENMIIMAAGNILYVFNDEDKCRNTVLNFPKKVMDMAPGITISQATVAIENDDDFLRASEELQRRLRIQRNKPVRPLTLGLLGMRRSRQTGLPAIYNSDGDFSDMATLAKLEAEKELRANDTSDSGLAAKNFGKKALESMKTVRAIDDLTGRNDWVAIIHADGNGLGQIVQKIGSDRQLYKDFSSMLNLATVASAQEAFSSVYPPEERVQGQKIQIRPIVLNGDDHTVIIRGDLAVKYAESFLTAFERNTKTNFSSLKSSNPEVKGLLGDGLTACAGIAFIKSSFPFYFGYNLAEGLCSYAKTEAKKLNPTLAPSCLMFHKVQDSFIENYNDIAERELRPQRDISFQFGPYYLHERVGESAMTIGKLLDITNKLNSEEGYAIKSHLRKWLDTLHRIDGTSRGVQEIDRLKSICPNQPLIDSCIKEYGRDNTRFYPTYDIMALSAILFLETK